MTFVLATTFAAPLAAALDVQVRAAVTIASITLAILTMFTTQRAQRLAKDVDDGIGTMSLRTVVAVLPETLLALATFGVLAAMSRLFRQSFSISHWPDRDHVVESLFSIAYLGFVALFLTQLYLVGRRLQIAAKNSSA